MYVISRWRHSDIVITFGWRDGNPIYEDWDRKNKSYYDPDSIPDQYHYIDDDTTVGLNEYHGDKYEVTYQEEDLENINNKDTEYYHRNNYDRSTAVSYNVSDNKGIAVSKSEIGTDIIGANQKYGGLVNNITVVEPETAVLSIVDPNSYNKKDSGVNTENPNKDNQPNVGVNT